MNQEVKDYRILTEESLKISEVSILQKTFLLLAVAFLTCTGGSLFAQQIFNPLMIISNRWAFIIGFFIFFYAMCFLIEKNRYSNKGIALLLVFTFGMGLLLAPLLSYTLSVNNGEKIVGLAAGLSCIIFLSMSILAKSNKINTNKLGNFLTMGAIVLIVSVVANLFLQINSFSLAISAIFVLFSSLLILWQVHAVISGGEDSYISAALTIFISLYNLFTNLIHLLLAFLGDD